MVNSLHGSFKSTPNPCNSFAFTWSAASLNLTQPQSLHPRSQISVVKLSLIHMKNGFKFTMYAHDRSDEKKHEDLFVTASMNQGHR